MKQKKVVHILSPDKFAVRFIPFINKEFNPEEHIFLCTAKPDDNLLAANSNIRYLHSPYRKHVVKNAGIFYNSIKEATKIILHGNPVLFYFALFPWAIKKVYWVIFGYELSHAALPIEEEKLSNVQSAIKKFVLKRVRNHISNIAGDSGLANEQFGSTAKCFYSPMYLSNVVAECTSVQKNTTALAPKKILAGNSTCPTNDHKGIFKMLLPYKDENILIYCPLSYGDYPDYKAEVIREGTKLFGDKFLPVADFMTIDEYNRFIDDIDIAVFNHQRQEAVGVMVSLMSRGKILYMNARPTSYKSFKDRGFQVFDNALIEREGLFADRDVSANKALVSKEYSYEKLVQSLAVIFND